VIPMRREIIKNKVPWAHSSPGLRLRTIGGDKYAETV